jgi:hypothetical protein
MGGDLVNVLAAAMRLQRFFEQGNGAIPEETAADWLLVLPSLLAGMGEVPLAARGGAVGSVANLANYLHRTGLDEGRLPRRDSVGMERLLHRWVLAAEAMGVVFERICVEGEAATAMEMNGRGRGGGRGPVVVNEGYQVSYCDGCGAELRPDGICMGCDDE